VVEEGGRKKKMEMGAGVESCAVELLVWVNVAGSLAWARRIKNEGFVERGRRGSE